MEIHGKVWWSELNTSDVKKAVEFYTDVVGYTFDVMPMEDGDYYLGMVGETPMIGVSDLAMMPELKGMDSHWMTYLAVADVDTAARKSADAGGTILRAPWDVPGVGRITLLTDPSGALIGLMTPTTPSE